MFYLIFSLSIFLAEQIAKKGALRDRLQKFLAQLPERESGQNWQNEEVSRDRSGLIAKSKWYWPRRTSNTEDLLVLRTYKNSTGPTNFSLK